MKKRDKTQGVVYVLPKSREFFGRISEDFEKVRPPLGSIPLLPAPCEDKGDNAALEELKEHLSKLVKLQEKLKGLLSELDNLMKQD